jgi:uncharacterized protein YjeT (DUF2065 family)
MGLIHYLAMAVILLVATYFIALGFIALIKPSLAARFLLGFAQNIVVHYCELLLRLIVGFALLHLCATMPFTNVIELFAWILIFSTMVLFVLPWHWHRQFAQKVVPYTNRYLSVIGVISLALGISLIFALNANAQTPIVAPSAAQTSHSSPSTLGERVPFSVINEANSFQYGSVCIDAAYRGQGVFPRLFETMRLGMCARYPIGVTAFNTPFNRLNPHSYHAHTKKLGVTAIDEFEFNDKPYYGLAFDMARSVFPSKLSP